MIDAITCIDLRLPIQPLLSGERLQFPLSVDEQTGEVLDRPRKAKDGGLEFALTPSTVRPPLRCKLAGSLHMHRNQGLHNADDYTAADLAATLTDLVTTYQIDLAQSPLNTLEFGVNVALPFPVGRVLDNLISYKNRLFSRELDKGKVSYECVTQRYVLKLYDKGLQHRDDLPGLPPNLLRVEMKVLKMAYLNRQGIDLRSLADLLDSTHYPRLGQLLLDTFSDILFDEPDIDLDRLNAKQQRLCLEGRDGRTWLIPDERPKERRAGLAKHIQRREQQFRALLATHRHGEDWVSQTAGLLADQWHRLTEPTGHQSGQTSLSLERCPVLTDSPEKCPLLTDFSEKVSTINQLLAKVSTINRLSGSHPVGESIPANDGRGTPLDSGEKRLELTPSVGVAKNPKVSTFNRLSIGLILDTGPLIEEPIELPRGTPVLTPFPAPLVSVAFSGRKDSISKVFSVSSESAASANLSAAISAPSSPSSECATFSGPRDAMLNISPAPIERAASLGFPTAISEPSPAPVVSEASSGRRESIENTPTPIPNKTPTTPPERLPRYCAVTGVEITHQPPKTHLATAKTLERLRKHMPAVYAQIIARFLPMPGEPTAESWRADNVARLIRLVDQSPTGPLQRLRACPLTHLDVTHQRPAIALASQLTLQQLAQDDPRTFERVSAAFLGPPEQYLFLPTWCHRLAVRLRQLVTEQAHYPDLANPGQ